MSIEVSSFSNEDIIEEIESMDTNIEEVINSQRKSTIGKMVPFLKNKATKFIHGDIQSKQRS